MMLARAARDANVPFIMSGTGTASIEELGRVAPEHGWYQIYAAKDKSISDDMIRRAKEAQLSTLVFTVDVPIHSNRERNKRNGMARPLRLPLKSKLEALMHPGWIIDYYRHGGQPMFPNWAQYAGPGAEGDAEKVASFVASQTAPPMTWDDVKRFRDLWPRNFVLKGIMHPADAEMAAKIGVDGIMVSNHGARQLDRAPSPVEVFPAIRDTVGDRMTLMLDSGVRRGSDILKALALGATAVGIGRPYIWGLGAFGQPGVERVLELLQEEMVGTMRMMGVTTARQIGPSALVMKK
jgi:L-lactate dehydrogenase (cytochrome)/(S)-mandelate dehydrogenase